MIWQGLLVGLGVAAYAVLIVLSVILLWQSIYLAAALTRLAGTAQRYLRTNMKDEHRSVERRMLELEDQLRLKNITQEEYEAKRQEILKEI